MVLKDYILKIGIYLKHEEVSINSELQSKRGLKQNKKKEAVATSPISQGLRILTTPVKLSANFDFSAFFVFFPLCPHVIVFCFVYFGNL